MHPATDLDYLVHRPGNPETHSLINGCKANPDASASVRRLAAEWLRNVPFVGIEIARNNMFIVVSRDHATHELVEFGQRTQERIQNHVVVQETPGYLNGPFLEQASAISS